MSHLLPLLYVGDCLESKATIAYLQLSGFQFIECMADNNFVRSAPAMPVLITCGTGKFHGFTQIQRFILEQARDKTDETVLVGVRLPASVLTQLLERAIARSSSLDVEAAKLFLEVLVQNPSVSLLQN